MKGFRTRKEKRPWAGRSLVSGWWIRRGGGFVVAPSRSKGAIEVHQACHLIVVKEVAEFAAAVAHRFDRAAATRPTIPALIAPMPFQ